MEKNKGIFPFRKHPVGELLDGKKQKKRKESRLRGANARKMHRALGMLLAAALICNTLPASGFAVSASEQGTGLCEHHAEHTAECGYAEAQPCTHEHGEECYKTVTECVHEHTDGCYPETEETEESTGEGNAATSDAENRGPSKCTHECSEESGCITKVLDCHHEHDESCGYQEAQECGYSEEDNTPCGYECRICPIEDLIAALPEQVREDNAADVRAQLDEILDLYRELTEDEQEQIDLSRVINLQGALDAANAPMTADGRTDQQAGDEASVTIGTETLYYATLEEAFEAANGQTATITMLTNAECIKDSIPNGSPLNITGGNVTLNLNGKTLSGKGRWGGISIYGIINVGGGALLVRGQGTVTVFDVGLTCNGGTLTVEDITLNLVVGDFEPNSGVANGGGTVVLNGTKMTGVAGNGQVCHYSGTTTINNVTATDVQGVQVGPNYCSVYHFDEGTLTINGGTFDKVVVDSYNYGGVKSVAGLLGKGYTYKKQGGTWATTDEMTGWEISNVTVEKIPLTINPQGDTSWFYSNQQTHTLAMNAAPVDGGNSVSYVWKSGTETLNCAEDTYTVPAGMSVGSYTYTCEATCDGYTLFHEFTFKIEKSGAEFTGGIKTYNGETETTSFTASDTITVKATPTGTGAAPQKAAARLRADPVAGQMAVYVGNVQVSDPVNAGDGGTYTMTVNASDVLTQGGVEPDGYPIALMAKFVGNDNMAGAEGMVTVNISVVAKAEKDGSVIGYFGLSDFEETNNLFCNRTYAGATITLLDDVQPDTNSEMGKICSTVADITCTLDLAGHKFTSTDIAIYVLPMGNLTIQDSSAGKTGQIISNNAAAVVRDGTVTLKGGTYTGTPAIKAEGSTLSGILPTAGDTCYAFYQNGKLIPLTEWQDKAELTGSVTVKECGHEDIKPTSNNDGAHTLTCPYCGYTGTAEGCTYGEYSCSDTSHTQTCTLCGYEKTQVHIFELTAAADQTTNTVTVVEGCETCGYSEKLGKAVITFENLTYKNPDAKVSWTKDSPAASGVMLKIDNAVDYTIQSENTAYSCSLTDLFGSTPVTAGAHTLKVLFYDDSIGRQANECALPFNVDHALLTDSMVTLDKTDVTYNGTEQKPALTVKQGQTTLAGGTDYTVSYTRSGVATNDFINAGTVTVTVTGKGNYTGTVTKEYTIGKADVPVNALTYTPPADLLYTGLAKTAAVTANSLTGIGAITVKYEKDNSGDLLAEAKEPGTYHVYADIAAGQNYNAAQIEVDNITISYMATPAVLYNGGVKKDWYNGDVDVSAGSYGYTVSDILGGDYKGSYPISAQAGTVAKTLYFKDTSGHISAGVDVEVKFDLTPPMGEIAVGAKWWQNVLHFISFGNYAPKAYTVSVKAEDTGGSGIDKIEYTIETGSIQYTDADALAEANVSWTAYNNGSRPTIPVNSSPYVVYARLTDKAGNVTYISTDGILLDSTAPTIGALTVPEETKKDVTAGVTFTVSETADYYYVVLPQGSEAPDPKDIIVTCGGTLPDGGTGTAIAGTVDSGKGAASGDTLPAGVSVEVKNLQPNTAYIVYTTAVDRALDITDSAEGKPAGNIATVENAGFATKKTLPVITKAPAVAGTYGQSVGKMTITGGTAQAGSTVLAGTWTVSDTDKGKMPSAGTAEVTVIFTPDNANYDSVSVQASLTVSQRNLNADGVTVSEVAGTYTYDNGAEIKPPVAVDIGTPTAGISVSDSGAALTANDFTVSYSNNKDAGTASVTIAGKGNYTGSVTKTFTIGKAPGRTIPKLTGSPTNDGQTYTYTLKPVEGAVYRKGDGAWTASHEFKGIKPGTSVTFYAKMPETGNYEEGEEKSITVDFPKLTPAAPALSYQADRTDVNDVKVTITPAEGAEYSFDGGTTWKSGEGANVRGGFTTSGTVTLAIRLKETDTHNRSPVQTVTVDLAKKDRGAPPALKLSVEANGETDYTVTIPLTEGCEYSFDGETWTENNVKTGVSIGETVTGYKRYKETDDYNASSAVSAKETMPKFTVKTPVISPAGGSCSGSVSVTIACGSPDAEIYYTTDGSTPGRSSARYTGAFTVSAPATVKAVAVKDGLNDSAVATASYTKKNGGGSGGNGGNSGGNENNGGSGGNDEGQGSGGNDSTNSGNANTTPRPSVTPPTGTNTNLGNETAPGTGTTPVNPGNGTTAGPGTAPGSGAGTSAEGTKQPFIKGEDGKIGWDVIRAEEEKAEEGSIINVDMNGSAVVPGDIFDSIKGKDITITFDMGNGILWSVDGKSIITDKAGDIDFSVQTGVNAVPVDIVNNVTGERYSIQLSLAYDGEFGFTAVLSIGLGRENAGYTASLYYYNESAGELEFICADTVAEDGAVSLAFTHASDYVIAIDGDGEEESGSAAESAQPEDRDADRTGQAEESPRTGQAWRPWRLIVVGALVIIMGIGVFFVVKKKQEDD